MPIKKIVKPKLGLKIKNCFAILFLIVFNEFLIQNECKENF